jgi:hypothetical protein
MNKKSQIQPGEPIGPAPETSSRREFLLGAVRFLLAAGLTVTGLRLWWRSPQHPGHPQDPQHPQHSQHSQHPQPSQHPQHPQPLQHPQSSQHPGLERDGACFNCPIRQASCPLTSCERTTGHE